MKSIDKAEFFTADVSIKKLSSNIKIQARLVRQGHQLDY
jgi:hypothetical protein